MEALLVVAQENILKPDGSSDTISSVKLSWAVYLDSADKIYNLLRWLFAEDLADEIMAKLSEDASKNFIIPYCKYEFCYLLNCLMKHLVSKIELNLHTLPILVSDGLCLYLRDKLGFSYSDIAASTGWFHGSIQTKVLRARRQLRTFLQADETQQATAVIRNNKSCIFNLEQFESEIICAAEKDLLSELNSLCNCDSCRSKCDNLIFSKAYFKKLRVDLITPPKLTSPKKIMGIHGRSSQNKFQWGNSPWYVKLILEGLLSTLVVMGVVISVPRIKSIYEIWFERRLEVAAVSEIGGNALEKLPTENTKKDSSVARLENGEKGSINSTSNSDEKTASSETLLHKPTVTSEFSDRDGGTASSQKIYRIMIKSDAPEAIQESVLKLLSGQSATSAQERSSLSGVELPGGIIFDVYVPLKAYKSVLSELGSLGETKVIITKSHKEVIPGKARLKIWLQRI